MLNIDSLGFIKNERNSPGDLLEKVLTPSKVESDFQWKSLWFYSTIKKVWWKNYVALTEFMKLAEPKFYILKYFLKLVRMKNL